jgi:hypothetical protein
MYVFTQSLLLMSSFNQHWNESLNFSKSHPPPSQYQISRKSAHGSRVVEAEGQGRAFLQLFGSVSHSIQLTAGQFAGSTLLSMLPDLIWWIQLVFLSLFRQTPGQYFQFGHGCILQDHYLLTIQSNLSLHSTITTASLNVRILFRVWKKNQRLYKAQFQQKNPSVKWNIVEKSVSYFSCMFLTIFHDSLSLQFI